MVTRIAVLDDWQGIALASADWSPLRARGSVDVLHSAFATEDAAAEGLGGYDIVLTMRERTAFPASLVRRLPKLRMLGMTGKRAASIDIKALQAQGVTVCWTSGGDSGAGTAELALGLMLAAVRRIPAADAAMRAGGFQEDIAPGFELAGKTLAILGLGRLGSRLARAALALDMKVIAWSANLTVEKAGAAGATLVSKEDLFARGDVISLHVVLSDRTRGIVGRPELARMKQGAVLINTSRGPLIEETALIEAVTQGRITAALDVFDREPLPGDHPFRGCANVVLTPHLGYCTEETFRDFYQQSVENAVAFLDGRPLRTL